MKVSDYDGWVIRYGKVFLVAVAYEDTKMCRFSESPYNAAMFMDMNDAIGIAGRTGGEVVRFNPVSGEVGA